MAPRFTGKSPKKGPHRKEKPLAIIDAELDPGICDKLSLMEKIEQLVQQTTAPRPIEA